MRMHERDDPYALAEIPQAVAAAARIKAERGFDPLDPDTLGHAILGYRKSRAQGAAWAAISGLTLGLVLIGAMISVWGALAGGLFVLAGGIAASWFPVRKMVRSYRTFYREMRPVIQGYEDVLRAAQPDPRSGLTAINRWRRRNGLR
jgi:hypothetical protein